MATLRALLGLGTGRKPMAYNEMRSRQTSPSRHAKADPNMGQDGKPKRKPPTLYAPGEKPQETDAAHGPPQ